MLRVYRTRTDRLYGDSHYFLQRPVYARVLRRSAGLPIGPPSEAEIQDAISLLADPYQDVVGDEAFRILDEYGQ